MQIDFSRFHEIVNDKYYPHLWNTDRYLVLYGSAGSGKSHFAAQKLIYRMVTEDVGHRFLVLRRYAPDLELSAYNLVKAYIIRWGLYEHCHITIKPMYIRYEPNGNEIYFRGMDDLEKVKSIENITGIWYEESTEALFEDLLQLDLRLRPTFKLKPHHKQARAENENVFIGDYPQIIQSYNPISKENWTYKENYRRNSKGGLSYRRKTVTEIEYRGKKQKIHSFKTVLHTTYRDNIYLQPEYVASLEELINKDEAFYKIYCLGEYADLKNKIFNNYKLIPEIPNVAWSHVYYGCDFGYVDPTAIVKCFQKNDDDGRPESIYFKLIFYRSGYHTDQLISWIKENEDTQGLPIYCDNAEPDRIQQMRDAALNARPCYKAKNFLIDSIDFMKMVNIFILDRDAPLKNEFYTYKWKEDKDRRVLEEPVGINDHGIAACRYGCYTMYIEGSRTPHIRLLKGLFGIDKLK